MRGVYILLMIVEKECRRKVGALGIITFKKGYYAYIGSEQMNLMKRIERHLYCKKKIRWHIDYFPGEIFGAYIVEKGKDMEEQLAIKLSQECDYINSFGSSDSRAPSHLFYFETRRKMNDKIENIMLSLVDKWFYLEIYKS